MSLDRFSHILRLTSPRRIFFTFWVVLRPMNYADQFICGQWKCWTIWTIFNDFDKHFFYYQISSLTIFPARFERSLHCKQSVEICPNYSMFSLTTYWWNTLNKNHLTLNFHFSTINPISQEVIIVNTSLFITMSVSQCLYLNFDWDFFSLWNNSIETSKINFVKGYPNLTLIFI